MVLPGLSTLELGYGVQLHSKPTPFTTAKCEPDLLIFDWLLVYYFHLRAFEFSPRKLFNDYLPGSFKAFKANIINILMKIRRAKSDVSSWGTGSPMTTKATEKLSL